MPVFILSQQNNKHIETVIPYKYRDKKLFLVLIPVINVLNYYLTYPHISFSWFTLFTFLIDTADGYIAWWMLRSIIIYLDKKLPYALNPLRRIIVQVVCTTLIGLLTIILLTELVNFLATDKPVPRTFYTQDIFIFISSFLIINGIYIGMHYYNLYQHTEQLRKNEIRLREEESRKRTEGFIAKLGKQNISVLFSDITGFYVEGDYAVVCTNEGKKYFLDQSLDAVEKSLPPEFFFRLNRQLIVNRNIVKGFERAENSKLNVLLKTAQHLPADAIVSRIKAPAFKAWFQPE